MNLKLLMSLVLGTIFCFYSNTFAQNCAYRIVSYEIGNDKNTAVVKLDIEVKNKKLLEQESTNTVLGIIMFEGLPGTKFSKPLLSEGANTMQSEFPEYFNSLYNERGKDFVTNFKMLSDFKKGPNKMTQIEITVKVMQLRKNLEKNKLIKHIGL